MSAICTYLSRYVCLQTEEYVSDGWKLKQKMLREQS